MAARYDIEVEKGTTYLETFTLFLDVDAGTLVKLTGSSARMSVRKKANLPEIINLNTTDGGITLGGEAGTVDLEISATDTGALPSGVYRYSLEIEGSGGQVIRYLEGLFTIDKEVTT